MLVFLLLIIVLVLTICVYVKWTLLKQYWAKRGVPHNPPHPVFGSMTFLQKENPVVWFRRMYHEYKEPYFGIWVFWRPGLIVNSPEIAKNILIKDQVNFKNRLLGSGTSDPVGHLNLFTVDDPVWSIMRRRLTILFTSSKLRSLQSLITQKSEQLLIRIEKERKKSEPLNLRKIMTDFTTDIIGTASFGVVSDSTLTGTSHIRIITEEFMKYSFHRGWTWTTIFFFPELVNLFRFKMFPTQSIDYMRKIFRMVVAQRGGFENKITDPKDLLDILIKMKQENQKELEMTENMMLAQAAIFLQGGFDTTGTTLTYAVYELAFNPDVQEKLFKELKQAKDIHGDNFLTAEALNQLTYLNCVINETMRKYPIMGWIDRIATDDYRVDEHLTIKAGTAVYVNAVGMHYDPDFYPEPERFNPDRFLSENVDNLKTFTFLPFGEGPRKCIGQRVALLNSRHCLAALVLNYEIRSCLNSPKPLDIKIDSKGILLSPAELMPVKFIPRDI